MYIVVVAKLLQYNVTNKHRYNVKVLLFVVLVIHSNEEFFSLMYMYQYFNFQSVKFK
jgi:hypothetical protein